MTTNLQVVPAPAKDSPYDPKLLSEVGDLIRKLSLLEGPPALAARRLLRNVEFGQPYSRAAIETVAAALGRMIDAPEGEIAFDDHGRILEPRRTGKREKKP